MLKYLFEAHFEDGHAIKQTPDDVSAYVQGKSAFYDVREYEKVSPCIVFGLYHKRNTYAVDLVDGHFEVNNIPFQAQPVSTPTINEGGKFSLIYYRDHQQDICMSGEVVDSVVVNQKLTEGNHKISFRFGWEYADPSGKLYQQTLVLI